MWLTKVSSIRQITNNTNTLEVHAHPVYSVFAVTVKLRVTGLYLEIQFAKTHATKKGAFNRV